MDSRRPIRAGFASAASPVAGPAAVASSAEAASFIRFCYRRRRAGWPELYDEMCAVASRRLYNGWGIAELADVGIGFSLFETPTLAALAREVAIEETERRARGTAAATMADPGASPSDAGADGVDTPTVALRLARAAAT